MRALFLDRDGVINVNHGHVGTRDRFEFIPGVFDMARAAVAQGYGLFVVTNQAGIARGLYSEADFSNLMEWVCHEFAQHAAPVIKVYHCPHHPEVGPPGLRMKCSCRKPAPGLLLRAASEFDIDLAASVMLGDSETDMLAGRQAGVGSLILVGGHAGPYWSGASSMADVTGMLESLGAPG